MRVDLKKHAYGAATRWLSVALAASTIQGCASFPSMTVAPEDKQAGQASAAQHVAVSDGRPGDTSAAPANVFDIPGISATRRPAPQIPAATPEQIAALVPDEPINAVMPPQPLPQYLNAIFSGVLKIPYSLGPDIGTRTNIITLNAPPTTSKRAYLALLQNTLRNYGLDMYIRGNAVLISESEATTAAARPQIIKSRSSADTPTSGRVVQVFQLVSLQASQELVNLVRSIGGAGGASSIVMDPGSNALSIEGAGRQVAATVDILRNLDQPAYAGAQVARLEPIYQTPEDFAANLQSALQGEGFNVSSDPLGTKGITILPLVSTNQALVFAADKDAMARVRYWAKEIDSPTAQGERSGTFVYEFRNTSASAIGQLLVTAGQSAQGARPGAATPGVVIGGAANNAQNQAVRTQQQQAQQQSQQVQQLQRQLQQQTGQNANRPATTTTTQQQQLLQGRALVGNVTTGGTITVDDGGNRILFTGSAAQFAQLRGLLQRLDVSPREVLIEVTVAEVTLTDETRAGLEFFFNANNNGWPISGGTGTFPAPTSRVSGSGPGQAGTGLGLGNQGLTLNFSNQAGDLRAAFNAFASNDKVNVLSRPHITAKSGNQAMIQVGDEVPIITSQRAADTQTGGNTDTLQTVQYRQTGVILTITPIVYGDDRVDITITQEVSDVRDNPNLAIGSPIIGSRIVSTTLTLSDGRSAVLGGLMEDSFGKSNKGVPFLKDIPLLGQAFRTDSVSGKKTEMVVLVTPMIIRDSDDMSKFAAQVTDDINKAFDAGKGASYTLTAYPLGASLGLGVPDAKITGGSTIHRDPPTAAAPATAPATSTPPPPQ